MKRRLRFLLHSLNAACLLMCTVTAIAWVSTYRDEVDAAVVHWSTPTTHQHYQLDFGAGAICVGKSLEDNTILDAPDLDHSVGWFVDCEHGTYVWWIRANAQNTWGTYEERRLVLGEGTTVGTFSGIIFPAWLAVLALAWLPALRLLTYFRRRQKQREVQDFCRICGYDLRATPDRCPECGSSNSLVGA